MKKHFYAYLIVALTFCGIFTSCKDDEPELGPVAGKTYELVKYDAVSEQPSSPITLTWEADATFPFLGGEWELNSLLAMVQMMELIEGPDGKNHNICEALGYVLNQISFMPDGSITAKYKDSPADASWKTSPSNYARYEMDTEGRIRVFINFDAIVDTNASRAGVSDLLPVFLKHLNKIMTEGFPVTVREVEGKTEFFIDQDTFFKLMNDLRPFFEDEAFVAELASMIAGALPQDMQALVTMIVPDLLKSIPNIMDKTTDVHFGINTVLVK